MPKPKAPSWLTAAFYEGVTAYALETRPRPAPPYPGAHGRCWLAQHDERRRACSGPFERFHFLRRQHVEDTIWRHLFGATYDCPGGGITFELVEPQDLILLAAWDPRNGDIGCEGHHRRYDSQAGPPLRINPLALPTRTLDFIFDYGLQGPAEQRFIGFNAALFDDRDERYSAVR